MQLQKHQFLRLEFYIFSKSGHDFFFFWKKKLQKKQEKKKKKKKNRIQRLQLEKVNWILHEATENKKY